MKKDFEGELGEEYDLFTQVCPYHTVTEEEIGWILSGRIVERPESSFIVTEIGCGTGITTRELLNRDERVRVQALDESQVMVEHTRRNLVDYIDNGRLTVLHSEATVFLSGAASNSLDFIVSAYAIHNMHEEKRKPLFDHIYRTLKPRGAFINGDKLAYDKQEWHAKTLLYELSLLSKLRDMGKEDLEAKWVAHYMRDDSPGYKMTVSDHILALRQAGFREVTREFRLHMDAIVLGVKK